MPKRKRTPDGPDVIDHEDLKCTVCLDYLRVPTESPCCANLFCKECVVAWFQTGRTCPSCRAAAPDRPQGALPGGWHVSGFLARKIKDIKVPCKWQSEGCAATPTLADREAHEAECAFRDAPCTFCKQLVACSRKQEHYAVCPKVVTECGRCGCLMFRAKLDSHDCLQYLRWRLNAAFTAGKKSAEEMEDIEALKKYVGSVETANRSVMGDPTQYYNVQAALSELVPPPPPRLSVYFFSVSFCPCLPGPLGLDKLSPTPPPCPLTA